MASRSICSRCLRLAISSKYYPKSTAIRAFSTTPLRQPSRRDRGIHSSSRHRLANAEPQTRSNLDAGYIHPLSHEAAKPSTSPEQIGPTLAPNDLFHSFTHSPSPYIRKRAAVIRQNAYCPHPEHQPTRATTAPHDPEGRKTGQMPPAHVKYECPDCGIPVSCSFEHYASDYEDHLQLCDTLRQINEDDHDLVSGRMFPEFEMPGPQLEEAQVNMTNWDTALYTREFEAVNDPRPMRQVTRLLTYPLTIGSVLHELSPYSLRDQLTPEGLRSLTGENPSIPISMSTANTYCFASPPLHPPPTPLRQRPRHLRPPSNPTPGASLPARRPRRIQPPPQRLVPTSPPLPLLNFPPDLHRAGEHGKPGRRIPSPSPNAPKSLRRNRRIRHGRCDENLNLRRVLPHPA